MSNRCVFVLSLLLATLGAVSPLSAQSASESARLHFESGTLAFNEARWLDCARDFEASFQGVFAPELLYNVGLCYQRASNAVPDAEAAPLLERSLAAYRRYLRELPDSEDAVRIQRESADLQARLTRIQEMQAQTPDPEPIVQEPTPPPAPPVPELVFESVPRGQYPVTILAGALTLVSAVIAIGLGVHAQDLYNGLSATCGRTDAGCSMDSINEVSTFALASNIMYGVSGVFLAGTAIGFGLEFSATDSRPSRAYLSVSGSF